MVNIKYILPRGWILGCCILAAALCWGKGLYGQGVQVPETLQLSDKHFFADTVTGAMFEEVMSLPPSDSIGISQGLAKVLDRAHAQRDRGAEALIHMEQAILAMRHSNPALAIDHVNHCLQLDTIIEPLSPLRQRMHLDIGAIYSGIQANRLAIDHLKMALDIDEKRSPTPTARRYRHCSNIAICYQKLGEYDSAFAYYHRAIDVARATGERYWVASSLNNLGMARQKLGDIQAALDTFRSALATLVLNRRSDLEFSGSINDNLGHAFLELGQPDSAMRAFQRNWDLLGRWEQPHAGFKASIGMARALLQLGRATAAKEWILRLDSLYHSSIPNVQAVYANDILDLQRSHALLVGDWKAAYSAQDSAMSLLSQQLSQRNQVSALFLERMIIDKTEKFHDAIALSQGRAAALRREARLSTWLLVASIIAGLLLAVGLWNILRRRNERTTARLEAERFQRQLTELSLRNQQLENDQLNHALEMKQRDITDLALVHAQRRKLIEELLESLKRLRQSDNIDRGLMELINSLRSKLDAGQGMSLDTQNPELVNNAFFDKLRKQFPMLSPAEMELCGMLRIGYSVKEIASVRNIEPASVRIAKTRLKKKLGLAPDDRLGSFLGSF